MNIFFAAVLGLVQGLTEFLPVSSSAHLALLQNLNANFKQPGVVFDSILHLGTVLAILIYFRKNLIDFIQRYFFQLVIATIPAVLVGLLFSDYFEGLFLNIKLVGMFLVITSLMNLVIHKIKNSDGSISLGKSLIIGLFQAFAIIPGISRSSSTIFAGSLSGVKKEKAAEFSFILSIPAVLGASFLQVYKYHGNLEGNLLSYLIGFTAAYIFGYLAIRLVLDFIKKGKFNIFFLYCFVLGFLVLLL